MERTYGAGSYQWWIDYLIIWCTPPPFEKVYTTKNDSEEKVKEDSLI